MKPATADLCVLKSLENATELSIAALYCHCQLVQENNSNITATKDAELQEACKQILFLCDRAVETQGIFSGNESQDDVATTDLKYALVPFYRAEFLAQCPTTACPSERYDTVLEAKHCLSRFLSRAEQYDLTGLLAKQQLQCIDRGSATTLDVTTKRQAKIDKFKRDKAISLQLKSLEQRAQAVEDGQENTVLGGPRGLDEEDERMLWKLKIESAVLAAIELLGSLQQELELLQHVAQHSEPGAAWRCQRDAEAEDVQKKQILQQLKGIALDLGVNDRQRIRQQVFRPSHTLPTMTIEEAAELELQDALRRQQAEQEAARIRQQKAEEARSDDEDEEELRKQRAWDDFKDANPYGSGNSKLRPCG